MRRTVAIFLVSTTRIADWFADEAETFVGWGVDCDVKYAWQIRISMQKPGMTCSCSE